MTPTDIIQERSPYLKSVYQALREDKERKRIKKREREIKRQRAYNKQYRKEG